MTRQEAEEALRLLAAEFKIPAPRIRWSHRMTRGRAIYAKHEVIIGPKLWRGMDCVLHEFAHLLQYKTTGRACRGHREAFVYSLRKTARAWYGDDSRYAWQTEYPTVRKIIRTLEDSSDVR
jgi:hypothetical protein